MKNILAVGLIFVLLLTFCACGNKSNSFEPVSTQTGDASIDEGVSKPPIADETPKAETAQLETEKTEATKAEASEQPEASDPPEDKAFPFEDSEGRTRYRLVINGTEVETENYPFTLPDEPKGGYYPIEDVLNSFGVACLTNEDKSACATVINGNIIKVYAGVKDMTYGRKTISSFGTVTPVVMDGVLYVPSNLLMQLSDNSIVDFSDDRSAATLETDIIMDASASGPAGLDVSILVKGSSSKMEAGAHRCPKCGGAGGHNKSVPDKYWNQGQWIPTMKTIWENCDNCGGTGVVK